MQSVARGHLLPTGEVYTRRPDSQRLTWRSTQLFLVLSSGHHVQSSGAPVRRNPSRPEMRQRHSGNFKAPVLTDISRFSLWNVPLLQLSEPQRV